MRARARKGMSVVRQAQLATSQSPKSTRAYSGISRIDMPEPPMPIEAATKILFVDNQVLDFLLYRMELAVALKRTGLEVHVALPDEPRLEEIRRKGIFVHVLYLSRTGTRPFGELHCCIALYRLYRRLRPTVVHHFSLKPTLYGGIASRFAGVPAVVSTLTGLGYLFTSDSTRLRALRLVTCRGLRFSFGHQNHRVIFQNPEDRDCLLARTGIPFRRTVLIRGSGVDPSLFTHQREADGPPVVLMASRLLWAKGVGQFVAMAQILRARGIRARFLLLGEPDSGHPSAIPLATLEHWRDSGDVEWPGWEYNMPVAIARSHIVCLPSLYGEGVPRILLEAAASGRPIVASNIPGCREVVRHGQNGLLVPPSDGEALARAISQLIENPSMRLAMGIVGRKIVTSEFSLERTIQANLDVYQALNVLPGDRTTS